MSATAPGSRSGTPGFKKFGPPQPAARHVPDDYVCSDRLKQLAIPRKIHSAPAGGRPNTSASSNADAASSNGDASADRAKSPEKRLTVEEQEKMANRLANYHVRQTKKLPKLGKQIVLTKEAHDKHVHHMYEETVGRIKRTREANERKSNEARLKQCPPKTIRNAELAESVARMYEKSIQSKVKELKRLHTKYDQRDVYHKHVPLQVASGEQPLNKKQVTELNERVYTEPGEKIQSKRVALFRKYVLDQQVKSGKLSPVEQMESADRLSKR